MRPFLIGIAGGSGSGKTSFIRALRQAFTEEQVCILSQDDYYLPRDQQHRDANEEYNYDLPKSFDKKAFRHDVQRLLEGEPVTRLEYVFNNPDAAPKTLLFQPAPIVALEGLFLFHDKKLQPLLDLKVFLYAKENLKIIRRIHRDQRDRGYPISDVLYKYQYHVLPAYERYILPYKDEADIVINNNRDDCRDFHRGVAVVTGFLRGKLEAS